MKPLKRLIPFMLCGALAFSPKLINAESWRINFFPEMPISRSTIADSDLLKTELNIPGGLEKEVLNKPLNDLVSYTTLSKEIPILSLGIKSKNISEIVPEEKIFEAKIRSKIEKTELSDEIFSMSLIANGRLKFSDNKKPEYNARAEIFCNSPVIDDYFSDGNKFFLNAGVNYEGTLTLENITEQPISSLPKAFNPKSRDFFGDLYFVIKSPYSDQAIILKTGFSNLMKDKEPNFNLSTTFELPSVTSWIEGWKNAKIIPYVSAGLKLPLTSQITKETGEFGMKITGESKKSIIWYIKGDLEQGKGGSYSSGIRLEL